MGNIYRTIDQLAEAKGMSRRELAKSAGLNPSTLNSALGREKGLTPDNLYWISKALGVPVGELFEP